ncbi:protein kinase [Streptomyces sp. NPDC019531]|uniref:serine/threonine-protein kinase n=1 Tax=Streptomyces sp. NPDC019531 TaxID=3365062 RepID=UPI00384F4353
MLNEVLAGRFRITGLLGSGGMGQVWAAEDERMRRAVAVKVVHPQFGTAEAETQARFQREVQLAGRLAHQNIVTVHDWGEVEVGDRRRTLYLVMELVRGVSLGTRLKETVPTPWWLAVGWAAQISQALDAAHGHGVVHRDIKPANALLTPEGTVKVLDFGVAKFMGETIGARELTVTGAPLGSPMYMSPEQAQGVREIDHRSDLYSLGCLLYHAVTGTPPFTSATPWAVLRMHIEDTPTAPAERGGDIPALLNQLILALLAKRPEDRPADAAAVHETLVTILVDHALAAPGGDTLDAAQPGHGAAVSGRLLKEARLKADLLIQATDNGIKRRRAEAEHDMERRRQAAQEGVRRLLEESRAAAEEGLAGARAEAEKITEEARQQVRKVVDDAVKEADAVKASAERVFLEALAEAERIVAEARQSARGDATVLEEADAALRDADAALRDADDAVQETQDVHTTPSPPEWDEHVRFKVVRQGYGRTLVDEHILRLEIARHRAVAELAWLEEQFVERHLKATTDEHSSPDDVEFQRRSAASLIAIARSKADLQHSLQPNPASLPTASQLFTVVRRGYDTEQVNQRVHQLVSEQNNAWARVAALKELLESSS